MTIEPRREKKGKKKENRNLRRKSGSSPSSFASTRTRKTLYTLSRSEASYICVFSSRFPRPKLARSESSNSPFRAVSGKKGNSQIFGEGKEMLSTAERKNIRREEKARKRIAAHQMLHEEKLRRQEEKNLFVHRSQLWTHLL